ncbi:hypothetical protein Vretimale_12716 [Volvox reticuliferus]|uniref:Uncharacterized protein n=1 Tax=Volvox reticuliferus TaxID=1737510 RepID=A0A8J4GJY5_9CHLO|nr:hypothetical protein Vretimale_12716 [Volvox reticuliferus]
MEHVRRRHLAGLTGMDHWCPHSETLHLMGERTAARTTGVDDGGASLHVRPSGLRDEGGRPEMEARFQAEGLMSPMQGVVREQEAVGPRRAVGVEPVGSGGGWLHGRWKRRMSRSDCRCRRGRASFPLGAYLPHGSESHVGGYYGCVGQAGRCLGPIRGMGAVSILCGLLDASAYREPASC